MRYVPLALLVLSLSFLLGRYRQQLFISSSNPVTEALPTSKSVQPSAPAKAAAPFEQTQTPPPHTSIAQARTIVGKPVALETTTGASLYSFLFDGDFASRPLAPQDLEKVIQRFRQPYPSAGMSKHISAADNEAVARIGLLKAFGEASRRHPNPATRQSLRSFYQSVLAQPHETLMVKRQALRSLASLSTSQNEKEQMQRLSQTEPRLLSLGSMTDQEIAEVALGK
ncbi:MAG: hypothetical protein ACK5P7_10490 [Bdellovibrio sp.]|jgi:hypothetical protein